MDDAMPTRPTRLARRRPLPPPKYRFVVTFPADLGDKVRELAARERRPLTTQVQMLVEQALGYEPAAVA